MEQQLATITTCPAPLSSPRRDRAVGVTLHSFEGRHRLEIRGPLPPGWIGALSHGLARYGLSIRRVRGRRDAQGHWDAEFSFASPAGLDLASVDFRGLLTRCRGERREAAIVLDSFSLVGPTVDGDVLLSLVGRDRVGFLATLLEVLALYSLFPRDISIETEGLVARDRLVLRGLAGRRPSAEACETLRRSLHEFVVREAADDTNVALRDLVAVEAGS